MVMGNMEIGVSSANLVAVIIIVLLTVVNVFGVKLGAIVQNIFSTAKVAALLGLVGFGLLLGRNAQAIAANFGAGWHAFWHNASFSVPASGEVGMGGPTALVGVFTVIAIVQVGSLFSADAWNNVTFTAGEVRNPSRNLPLSLAIGYGRGAAALYSGELCLSLRAAAAWRSEWDDAGGAGHSIRHRRPRGYGGAGSRLSLGRRVC